jgi:hypothetical protein
MIKSKAADIIRKLNEGEKQELILFLCSPYFNRKKKIGQLCEIIIANTDKLDDPEITEEDLFKPLFGSEKFSYSFIRNLMSELLRLCEVFLVINNLKSNSFSNNRFSRILLHEYNSRFLDKHFELKLKKIREEYSTRKIDSEYFDVLGKLESENIAFHLYRSSMQEVPAHLLKRAEYNFIHILQLLEFDLMDLAVNKVAFNLNYDAELVPSLMKIIDTDKMLGELSNANSEFRDEIEIRLRLIKLCDEKEDDENYHKLKDLILKKIENYSNAERSNMLIKLKNYCAFKIYKGDPDFYEEKYVLLKKELETVKYNQDSVGPLFANIYLEIIQKAILKKDLKYACEVIDKFTQEIETSKQAAVSNMARAWIEFEKNDYEKTLHYLSQVNAFNLFLKINTKMLYMRVYYEMNALETGLSSVDSFRHFIMESKELGNSRRENLQRNYEIIKRIYKMKLNPGKHTRFDLNGLRNDVEKSEIYYSEWYFQKIIEMENDFYELASDKDADAKHRAK